MASRITANLCLNACMLTNDLGILNTRDSGGVGPADTADEKQLNSIYSLVYQSETLCELLYF